MRVTFLIVLLGLWSTRINMNRNLILTILVVCLIVPFVSADFTLPNYDGDINQVMISGTDNVLYWSDIDGVVVPQPDIDLNIVGECFIPTNSCDNEYLVNGAGFCDYNIVLPDDANRIYIEIVTGNIGSLSNTAFYLDSNITLPIWVDKKTMPIYLICKEVSSTYFVQDVISTVTLGVDENYNNIEVTKTYTTTTRDDLVIMVLAGLLLVFGLFGMIKIIGGFFK